MSRVQLALRVSDLEASIVFYSSLFGVEPAKRRPGYANFAVAEPPLKLVLLEGQPGEPTVMDHLGVEVETTGEVDAATSRLAELGLFTKIENDTTCCYAVQDKVWVHGPGAEPWEVYTVKADAVDATSIHPSGGNGVPEAPGGECVCGLAESGEASVAAPSTASSAAHPPGLSPPGLGPIASVQDAAGPVASTRRRAADELFAGGQRGT